MNILLIFFFASFLFSQTKIRVFTAKTDVLISEIEKDILMNIFSLYNKANNQDLTPVFETYNGFKNMMTKFDESTAKYRHSMLSINRITITDSRQLNYDFSSKYLPGQLCYIALKDDFITNTIDRGKKLVYVKGTVHETVAKKVHEQFQMPIYSVVSSIDFYDKLKDRTYDYGIIENVSIWNKKDFFIIKDLEYQLGTGYGILYPKNSDLRDKLDKYLIYYLKSPRFKKLLKKSFGDEVVNYFVKSMLNK